MLGFFFKVRSWSRVRISGTANARSISSARAGVRERFGLGLGHSLCLVIGQVLGIG